MNADEVMKFDPDFPLDRDPFPTLGAEPRYLSLLEHHGSLQVIVPYSRARRVARMTSAAGRQQALSSKCSSRSRAGSVTARPPAASRVNARVNDLHCRAAAVRSSQDRLESRIPNIIAEVDQCEYSGQEMASSESVRFHRVRKRSQPCVKARAPLDIAGRRDFLSPIVFARTRHKSPALTLPPQGERNGHGGGLKIWISREFPPYTCQTRRTTTKPP